MLLDVPGQTYWEEWEAFVRDELVGPGWVSTHDVNLYTVTDDADEAVESPRLLAQLPGPALGRGDRLVIRLRAEPTAAEVAGLNEEFADLAGESGIQPTGPLPAERSDADALHLHRLVLNYDVEVAGSR